WPRARCARYPQVKPLPSRIPTRGQRRSGSTSFDRGKFMRRSMSPFFALAGLVAATACLLAVTTFTGCTHMTGCSGCNPPPAQWLMYRNNPGRYAWQFLGSNVSNATSVLNSLHVGWKSPNPATWTAPTMPAAFRASPIVFNNTVFIGDVNGVFWALNAADGTFKWRFPATGSLKGSCTMGGNGSWGAYGIQSSATYASIETQTRLFSALLIPIRARMAATAARACGRSMPEPA